MAFYLLDPDEGERWPRGKVIRFKTLHEAREYMKARRNAGRVFFHDLPEGLFYLLDPDEGERWPRGKVIRLKTLHEAREYMKARRNAGRVFFHDLPEGLSVIDAIDVEDLPRCER